MSTKTRVLPRVFNGGMRNPETCTLFETKISVLFSTPYFRHEPKIDTLFHNSYISTRLYSMITAKPELAFFCLRRVMPRSIQKKIIIPYKNTQCQAREKNISYFISKLSQSIFFRPNPYPLWHWAQTGVDPEPDSHFNQHWEIVRLSITKHRPGWMSTSCHSYIALSRTHPIYPMYAVEIFNK